LEARVKLDSAALALGAALALVGAIALAAEDDMPEDRCMPQVESVLTRLAVDRTQLARIAIWPVVETREADDGRLRGIEAWAVYTSVKGALVIDMFRDCALRQVYTRGELRLPGLKAF
jgi:hypothetical protein